MGNGIFKWYVGRGAEPEVYHETCDSREEAIQVGQDEYHSLGDSFTIVEADRSVVIASGTNTDWLVERLIEELEETNEECWGENGPDDPWTKEAINELGNRLDAVVAQWLKDFPADTWSFGTMRNEEFFPAPEHEE